LSSDFCLFKRFHLLILFPSFSKLCDRLVCMVSRMRSCSINTFALALQFSER
jgi:hypothetical protein